VRPPSVDVLARDLADLGLPHPLAVDAARAAIAAGEPDSARARAAAMATNLLRPVINATGVLLHTNLGRAPLGHPAPSQGEGFRYANIEIDMTTGRRGSRSHHAASLLARAAGAESALVVNNGAAAVLLVLSALAAGKKVAVSRGELVEIGGGFRIPEVMAQSGARLVEVGTTNRTRLGDYRSALEDEEELAALLKVHPSNYKMIGFTESVGVSQLATLGPPVVVDLGSGLLDASAPWLAGGPPAWLQEEPAVRQTLAAGAALVTFSGDKLLGGPQAGVIAGRADLVEKCARHPLSRALRPGGLVLGALQEVALAYLNRDGDAIPFWRMATADLKGLRERAEAVAADAGSDASATDSLAVAGGGSAPGLEIPSAGVMVEGDRTDALRSHVPPVVARVHEGCTICDLRTVDPADDPLVTQALRSSR